LKKILLVIAGFFAAACTSLPMVDVPSANQSSRINFLVIHFTSEHFAESMRLLTQPTDRPVSVHYLVPEPGDETYDRERLLVHRLVHEPRRARHAGVSYWAASQSMNNSSIGIEIVNQSRCEDIDPEAERTPENQVCTFLDFPEEQIELVIRLAKYILDRNPDIEPIDVVGHADIAPDRRLDPGPKFPWKRLYENGIGAWYDDGTVARYRAEFDDNLPDVAMMQRAMSALGYRIEETGEDDVQTRFVVRAFQMRFRPAKWGGGIDTETAAILFALLEKYRPESLEELSKQKDTEFIFSK
jgi:N-acetylmuramoyl-L-alanine amidase